MYQIQFQLSKEVTSKPMKRPEKTLWSDEDGVIAVYEPHAYKTDSNGNSLFTTPNVHYFMQLEKDERIIQAYQDLQQKNLPVCVLTNLTDIHPLYEEHQSDKSQWTKNAMPFLDMQKQFFTIHVPKWQYAMERLKRPLCKTDILVSDYNNDLIPWEQAGGTGVKYLNGINSDESFKGAHIPMYWSAEQIVNYILSL